MQAPTMYAGFPVSNQRPESSTRRGIVVSVILVVLVIVLMAAGVGWLQWAAHRGLSLGYLMPQVHISSSAPGSILIDRDFQFSADARGRDLTYTWDFGDGSTAIGPSVNHTYQSNGNFTITVTVTDPIGQSSSNTMSVTVTPPPPTASFTSSTNGYGYAIFDASNSSADPSTSIANYSWDFGDGNTDPNGSVNESHYYYSSGTYTVTLIVTDATGQQSQPYTASVVI